MEDAEISNAGARDLEDLPEGFCHDCELSITPQRVEDDEVTCPICGGMFVELTEDEAPSDGLDQGSQEGVLEVPHAASALMQAAGGLLEQLLGPSTMETTAELMPLS